uniref:Galectin n=1 Tax=Panagrellus redivivus TaxID=6233 RepID=A0A7E4W3H1_PANRE
MNKFIVPILVVTVLQFTQFLSVAGGDNEIPLIKAHACSGAAYTYGYHGFSYYDDEFIPYLPQKTWLASHNFYAYIYRLREQFTIGQTLYVRGLIPNNTEWISINLLAKTPIWKLNTGATILNMGIFIKSGHVMFDRIIDGKWDPEVTTNTSLRYDEEFDVTIRAFYNRLEVRVNGKKIHDYKPKHPLEIVDTVNVHGNAFITDFRIGGRSFNNVKKVDFPGGHWKRNERLVITGVPKKETVSINLLHTNGTYSIYHKSSAEMQDAEVTLNMANMAHGIVIYVNREYSSTIAHGIDNPEYDYKAVSFTDFEIHDLEICTNLRI